MSLPLPLALRLSTSRAERHITSELRDLQFASTIPGGFAAATASFDRPLSLQPDELTYFGKGYIYDTRSGATVWEGRIEDPGRSARSDGEVWSIALTGPAAHAKDRTIPLIYIDRRMNVWVDADKTTPGGVATISDDPGTPGQQVMLLRFPQGTDLVTNSRVTLRYWEIKNAGQKLARVSYAWDAGVTAACSTASLVRTAGGGAADTVSSDAWNTTGGNVGKDQTTWTAGRDTVDLRIIRTGGAATVTTDTFWSSINVPCVMAMIYKLDGTDQTVYGANYYLSSDIVTDLLTRLLPAFDTTTAAITTGLVQIDQMAYPDGVNADTVLADLMGIDVGYYWAAWETNPLNSKYKFEWKAWPTTVRYECDAVDGFDSPGSADGLYDAVRVRWTDNGGRLQNTRRTQTVAELAAAGFDREAIIDLGDNLGSSTLANAMGDAFLADHLHPPNAGTLTVARPIMDLVQGRRVWPWEIRPGNLIRVRGILPRVDALNATARDGVTVFRVTGNTFNAAQAASTLELDAPPHTTARMLADLKNRPVNRRR